MNFCANCGAKGLKYDNLKCFKCPQCDWEYYQNVAAAVMGLLLVDDKVVFVVRNQEPAKGKIDCPGGFVDPDETAEEALIREVKEELHIEISSPIYLGSHHNTYTYKGVTYKTCDLIYAVRINSADLAFNKEEISALKIVNPAEIHDDEIAFPTVRKGIELLDKWIIG